MDWNSCIYLAFLWSFRLFSWFWWTWWPFAVWLLLCSWIVGWTSRSRGLLWPATLVRWTTFCWESGLWILSSLLYIRNLFWIIIEYYCISSCPEISSLSFWCPAIQRDIKGTDSSFTIQKYLLSSQTFCWHLAWLVIFIASSLLCFTGGKNF